MLCGERDEVLTFAGEEWIGAYEERINTLLGEADENLIEIAFADRPQDCEPDSEDHSHLTLNEIGRHCWQRIITVSNPAVFGRYVLTLEITHVRKTVAERSIEAHGNCLPQAAEITNHRHR